jgi:hypothetical protein
MHQLLRQTSRNLSQEIDSKSKEKSILYCMIQYNRFYFAFAGPAKCGCGKPQKVIADTFKILFQHIMQHMMVIILNFF